MNKTNDNLMLLNGGGLCNTPPRTRFNNILIDYLTFTWTSDGKDDSGLQSDLIKLLNIKIGEICDNDHKALYGYKTSIKWGLHILFQNGLKLQDGRTSSMLQLSGQAVRDLEKRNVNFLDLFIYVIRTNGRCVRFDLAYDDFNGDHCDIFKILDYVVKYSYVSSIDTVKIHLELSKNSRVKKGSSLTFGKSKVVLQIYDKKLERLANHYDVWTDFWHRYEMRFKDDIAHTVLHDFIEILKSNDYENKLIKFYFGRLYQILDIKEFSDNVNISEVPTVKWWSDFLGDYSKIEIRSQFKTESTITSKRKWILNSVIKPLTKVALASVDEDHYFKELRIMCDEMKNELDQTEKLEIKEFKEDEHQYIQELSYEDINSAIQKINQVFVDEETFFETFKMINLSYKFNSTSKENIETYLIQNVENDRIVNFLSKIISN